MWAFYCLLVLFARRYQMLDTLDTVRVLARQNLGHPQTRRLRVHVKADRTADQVLEVSRTSYKKHNIKIKYSNPTKHLTPIYLSKFDTS